jgi:hypothetical protein
VYRVVNVAALGADCPSTLYIVGIDYAPISISASYSCAPPDEPVEIDVILP